MLLSVIYNHFFKSRLISRVASVVVKCLVNARKTRIQLVLNLELAIVFFKYK